MVISFIRPENSKTLKDLPVVLPAGLTTQGNISVNSLGGAKIFTFIRVKEGIYLKKH